MPRFARSLWQSLGLLALVVLAAAPAEAAIRLPKVFGSHMVLQRDIELPFWGWADPGEEVSVTLGDAKVTAKADEAGKWSLKLPKQKAGGPHEIAVAGKNVVYLTDVLVGDVWVCSGQSNMEWPMTATKDAQKEIAAAKYPKIRLFHIPKTPAGKPVDDVAADWKACDPATVPSFSAVAFFFGRELQKELDVPIGLINTSWGGTRIEPWTPPVGFESVENPAVSKISKDVEAVHAGFEKQKLALIDQMEAWAAKSRKDVAAGKEIQPPPAWPGHPLANAGAPTGLYNGMVSPIVPFGIRGAIWYQGESNLSEGMLYHDKMKALIGGWRKVWNQGDFPFLFVQLAPFRYGNNSWEVIAGLWEAQTATLAVPNTGMAVTTDIGNLADIHPNNKQDVGKRLALWALANTYGKKDLVYFGPLYKSAKPEGAAIRVSYDFAKGLKTTDGAAPKWFEVAGADGKYEPADAKIDGESIVVSSAKVSEPKSVRYGWTESEKPNLVNGADLPACPFRSATPAAK